MIELLLTLYLLKASDPTTLPCQDPDPELGCIDIRLIETKSDRDQFPEPRCPGSSCPDNAKPN